VEIFHKGLGSLHGWEAGHLDFDPESLRAEFAQGMQGVIRIHGDEVMDFPAARILR
jgi:hypothetical protein